MKRSRLGDVTTPVLLWFTAVTVGILLVVWYIKASSIGTNNVAAMDEDLKNLHYDFALACNNEGLIDDVPLRSAPSTLDVNSSDVCVNRAFEKYNITRCLPMPCDLGQASFILKGAPVLRVNKSAAGTTLTLR